MNQIGFKLAFSVESYFNAEMKADPKYVKYIVRIYGLRNGIEFQEMIPFHKCTDDDYNDFLQPLNGVEDQFKLIRDNEKRGMFCIDDYENFKIYGNEKNTDYQRFEIILVPCNYLHI